MPRNQSNTHSCSKVELSGSLRPRLPLGKVRNSNPLIQGSSSPSRTLRSSSRCSSLEARDESLSRLRVVPPTLGISEFCFRGWTPRGLVLTARHPFIVGKNSSCFLRSRHTSSPFTFAQFDSSDAPRTQMVAKHVEPSRQRLPFRFWKERLRIA